MDRVLISWSVPNLFTVWLMVFAGFLLMTIVTQFVLKRNGSAPAANNSSGY